MAVRTQQTIARQWEMLRLMPRHPRKIAARELQEKLAAADYEVTKRTLERDLQALSLIFPLVCDDREKPFGWSWQKDAPAFALPGLSAPEALALKLIEQHLLYSLPKSVADVLAPYFRTAERVLATPSHRKSAAWLRKIRVVSPAQPLLSPAIDPAVQGTIYDALLDEKLIRLIYQRRGKQKPQGYTLRPLAVVQRGPVMYLVAALETADNILIFAFHRMKAAVVLPDSLQPVSGFDIDQYLASGAFGWGDGVTVQLEAIFSADAAEHLRETPLAKDQRLILLAGERVKVKATVSDTPQLQWWLLGFGDAVEVVAPKRLRSDLQKTALAMSRLYSAA